MQHILSLVSHPILNFLYRWIYDGELEDTYHEVSFQKFPSYFAAWPNALNRFLKTQLSFIK